MTFDASPRPVALLVLDGFGLAEPGPGNAVARARTPHFDHLWREAPHTTLQASGPAVGLPEGQMGNSEVGHLNLGAGRVVQQSLGYIQAKIDDGSFFEDPVLQDAFDAAAASGGTVHLLGLASRGGVHSDLQHLFALLRLADRRGDVPVRVHAFTDGRDTAPDSGRGYLSEVEAALADLARVDARLASVTGRYWAMDRDRRWDRTRRAYDAVVCGRAEQRARAADEAITAAYARGETDEFVAPTVLVDEADAPLGEIRDGDTVLWFNFRADRARQLTEALVADPTWDAFERCRVARLHVATLMEYDPALSLPYAFALPPLPGGLAETVARAGLPQYHAAETEKYPHVTYFFNAQREEAFPGETRELIPSPQVATYDLQPEMSAPELTEAVVRRLREHDDAFVLVNFANPDMVGHTGDLGAAVRACEAVDAGLGAVLEALREKGGAAVVVADHGNAEQMLDDAGGPHTAHTTNPVPCVVVGPGRYALRPEGGALGDVAPTVLALMGLEAPPEMTGRSLLDD